MTKGLYSAALCAAVTLLAMPPASAAADVAQASQPATRRVRLVPRSEAASLPGYRSFIAALAKAVRERDARAILALTSDSIRSSVGNDRTDKAFFRANWKLDDRSSEFWTMASRILNGGSAVDEACASGLRECSVTIPFWSARVPAGMDVVRLLVATSSNVPVFEKPDTTSRIVERVSYDIVHDWGEAIDAHEFDDRMWTAIQSLDMNIKGFVRTREIYALVGARMTVSYLEGGWRITAFVAGD